MKKRNYYEVHKNKRSRLRKAIKTKSLYENIEEIVLSHIKHYRKIVKLKKRTNNQNGTFTFNQNKDCENCIYDNFGGQKRLVRVCNDCSKTFDWFKDKLPINIGSRVNVVGMTIHENDVKKAEFDLIDGDLADVFCYHLNLPCGKNIELNPPTKPQ